MTVSRREKLLLLSLGVLVGLIAVYYAIATLLGFSTALEQKIERREVMRTRAGVLASTLQVSSSHPLHKEKLKGSLIGYLEELAGKNALGERIQLNRVPVDKSRGVEAIDIKLDQLSLDEAVGFVYTIENSKFLLVVDQMEITNSFRAKQLLRLSMRVLAQK